jgi:hypothetical protein
VTLHQEGYTLKVGRQALLVGLEKIPDLEFHFGKGKKQKLEGGLQKCDSRNQIADSQPDSHPQSEIQNLQSEILCIPTSSF